MMDIITVLENYPILRHEYLLVVYGVLAWQLEQLLVGEKKTLRKRLSYIWASMIWGGIVVVFDDEFIMIAQSHFPKLSPDQWWYVGAGFFIEILRHKVEQYKNNKGG